ncbi:GNAT family N-acetyltransferase [Actinoplanes sp. LDG1-06]|uniref:GNAT family N-acetyltransferase n=1 Tax=Paractinoplanes ovalisporus TaxID=2810368 RepID=A0ABS2A316_9ACTN|nr:GNAT family N-acetyltransferase [Actinoplanes ovalisporus]MBM2614075.1 GNAT family N-acetyltransferase [Actinoplanes ovalisporus]
MTSPYRSEIRLRLDDPAAQRDVIALGYRREGIARGAGPDREDMVVWARLEDDPEGPSPRVLPDLPGGELTDGVIRIRALHPDDLDGWYELRSLPESVAASVPPVVPPREEVERFFSYAEGRWLAGEVAAMTILDARSGKFAGQIALYYFQPHHREGMLGYGVLPAFRGRGYARRAVQLVTKWAFNEARLQRVVAGTAVDNIASQKTLQAAGFEIEAKQVGILPAPNGGRLDAVLYVRRRL